MMNSSICETCGGFGRVTKDVPIEHPDFGKSFPCPDCNIAALRKRDVTLRMSDLQSYADKTFTTFKTDLHWLNEDQQRNLSIAYDLAYGYAQNPKGWRLFMGRSGVGKTHLAAAIAHEVINRGERAIFATAPDLLDYLREAFAPNAEDSYGARFDLMKNIYLLVLDDLGTESPSKWAQEKLYQLLNHRYVNKLPTVITTNLDEDDFEERLASRLSDSTLTFQIRINIPDFRRGGVPNREQNFVNDLSNLARYKDMTFDSFEVLPSDKSLANALRTARKYVEFKDEKWLVIIGANGSGKTHLAAAIANHWLPQPMMVSTPDLIDFLRATFDSNVAISLNNRFDEIRNSPMLVLDNFEISEKGSYWVNQKLFQLIDHRYLEKLPTVIVINDDKWSVLKEKFPEFHSRLADNRLSKLILLKSPDYRRQKTSSSE